MPADPAELEEYLSTDDKTDKAISGPRVLGLEGASTISEGYVWLILPYHLERAHRHFRGSKGAVALHFTWPVLLALADLGQQQDADFEFLQL